MNIYEDKQSYLLIKPTEAGGYALIYIYTHVLYSYIYLYVNEDKQSYLLIKPTEAGGCL